MPAINVAKSDTFETQRQKINQIGSILNNISAGGSDLQTGNLKLGDGTKGVPSLSFINDSTLGVYRADNQDMSWVSGGKNLISFRANEVVSFQDFNVRKRSLLDAGISIQETGENYDEGIYTAIDVIGGSGSFGTVNLTVEAYEGTITNQGTGYLTGAYSDIGLLTDGSGTEILVEFATFQPIFSLNSSGSGYTDGEWSGVPTTSSGIGDGFLVDIIIESGVVTFTTAEPGSGHLAGDTFSVSNDDISLFDDETGTSSPNTGSGLQFIVSNTPNSIDPDSLVFTSKGTGSAVGDVFTTPTGTTRTGDLPGSVTGVSTTVSTSSAQITVPSTTGILSGMTVTQNGGEGAIAEFTLVQSIDSSTTLTLDQTPTVDGTATLDFASENTVAITLNSVDGIVANSRISGGGYIGVVQEVNPDENTITIDPESTSATENVTFTIDPPYGTGSGFQFTVDKVGTISSVNINEGGSGYAIGDLLSVRSTDITQPINVYANVLDLQLISVASPINVSVGSTINGYTPPDPEAGTPAVYSDPLTVKEIISGSSGNATEFVVTAELELAEGAEFVIGGGGTVYTVAASGQTYRYLIGFDENNLQESANLNLYVNNSYFFTQTDGSRQAHPLFVSTTPDGTHTTVENISTTLSTLSPVISVSNSAGITAGMAVSVESGDGEIQLNTLVESVDGNNITLSATPSGDGAVFLTFTGIAYTDGVISDDNGLTITITESTPTLYYYCANHSSMGGTLTMDLNNPKVFGSGFELIVSNVLIEDLIATKVDDGSLAAVDVTSTSLTTETVEATTSVTTELLSATTVSSDDVQSTGSNNLAISSAGDINLNSQNLVINNVTINSANSTITASGSIKTETNFNVNDIMTLANNNISTNPTNNLLFTPGLNRVAKVNTNTALIIPVGNNSERPGTGIVEDGAIRFNTETNQYEGYSATNSQWSSLGGVRDLDGNTTILAEEFVGANDNTLWFINDNINTLRVTRNHLEFVTAKKIKSVNTAAPDYNNWTANTPVTAGQYLKYRNNIYEVIVGGITGTSGNEPTDSSGDSFSNGTSTLQYFTTAVSTLTFEEISEVSIDPLGFTDLVVNGEMRHSGNTISSATQDIVIKPFGSQKVEIDCQSSLVLPVGDSNSKGNPVQGSVRYNTTDSQFEGYNGAQWGGLGGVKDIDQDTKIQAETGPGNDEDILYFFNAGDNTLRLSTTKLVFDTVNTIESADATFAIDAATVTFDSGNTTIENNDVNSTQISTIKDNLDFGLSTGIFNDHLLRLTDTGTVVFNLGFSTGTPNNLTVLNNNLTNFELLHTKLNTLKLNLIKGTTNSANGVVYNPSTEASGKVVVTAHNTTTGDKEVIEFLVVDKGSDIFYTDFGNLKTGADLISTEFDFDPINRVRITFNLDANLTSGDTVQITVVNTITKR